MLLLLLLDIETTRTSNDFQSQDSGSSSRAKLKHGAVLLESCFGNIAVALARATSADGSLAKALGHAKDDDIRVPAMKAQCFKVKLNELEL